MDSLLKECQEAGSAVTEVTAYLAEKGFEFVLSAKKGDLVYERWSRDAIVAEGLVGGLRRSIQAKVDSIKVPTQVDLEAP